VPYMETCKVKIEDYEVEQIWRCVSVVRFNTRKRTLWM